MRFFCGLLLSVWFSSGSLLALDPMHGPRIHQRKAHKTEISAPAQVGQLLVRGFQLFISPADGPRSPSYPTGSQYAVEVLAQEGLFWGLLMTGDRLFHEADLPLGPLVDLHHKIRFYDPPLYNRYWR